MAIDAVEVLWAKTSVAEVGLTQAKEVGEELLVPLLSGVVSLTLAALSVMESSA